MYGPYDSSAVRKDRFTVAVTLLKDNALPPYFPLELHGVVNEQDWSERIAAVRGILEQRVWRMWMRIWFGCALLFSIFPIFPILALVRNAVANSGASLVEIRLAFMGILIGLFLVAWGPLTFWRIHGTIKLNRLLRSFSAVDTTKGSVASLTWTVERVSMWRKKAELLVSLPVSPQPTNFSHGAYLPPYIHAPPYGGPGLVPLTAAQAYAHAQANGYTGVDQKV